MRPEAAQVETGLQPRGPLIELVGVEKVYRTGKVEFPALRGIDLTIDDGEMVAIVGPSGSGKSTIMNMITGIDRPTAGSVTVREDRIDRMSEEELESYARDGTLPDWFQTEVVANGGAAGEEDSDA